MTQIIKNIPFHRPTVAGKEVEYIIEALGQSARQGGGRFTNLCHELLRQEIGAGEVFLTNSCTNALEMGALLADLKPGDEVILPSFTFVSTANSFVLRGAIPVFVDIDPATQNLDPEHVANAITPSTKAVCVVHYAGVGADLDSLRAICDGAGLILVEDAAQAIGCSRNGIPLGCMGHFAAFSFHDTKNLSSGEGGALAVNDPAYFERAHIIWEKGTNRRLFLNGAVDKYTWVDVGSSFMPSEITAAMLFAQLSAREQLISHRVKAWARYHGAFKELEARGKVARPFVPEGCLHNGHLFYLILEMGNNRDRFIAAMRERGIQCAFHYVPLHSSSAGLRFGKVSGPMTATDRAGHHLVRLPLWSRMPESDQAAVIDATYQFFSS